MPAVCRFAGGRGGRRWGACTGVQRGCRRQQVACRPSGGAATYNEVRILPRHLPPRCRSLRRPGLCHTAARCPLPQMSRSLPLRVCTATACELQATARPCAECWAWAHGIQHAGNAPLNSPGPKSIPVTHRGVNIQGGCVPALAGNVSPVPQGSGGNSTTFASRGGGERCCAFCAGRPAQALLHAWSPLSGRWRWH